MFKKIKDALFSQSLPSEQEQINERKLKIQKKLGGRFNAHNNGVEWYGYTWKEILGDYFGYFHWQGQYFIWRENLYDGEAASLVLMGHAFTSFFKGMKKATTEYPTPEESAFMDASKTLWEQVTPTFGHMSEQQAIELFFGFCLGPDTPLMQQENYNMSGPFEQTYLFHTNRTRCSSVAHARQLDQAYYHVFRGTMAKIKQTDFTSYMDHPYSPVVDGKLGAAIPLPGVEQDLSLTPVAINHAKMELIILNDLLAEEEYTPIRKYLGMTGTHFSDYEVTTAAYAVKDPPFYGQFVEKVIRAARSVDWVLVFSPMMLRDIKAKFEEATNEYLLLQKGEYLQDDKEYSLHYPFEKIPEDYSSCAVGKDYAHQDWLQERRNEADRIFAQFPHITGEKPPAPVEVISDPVVETMAQDEMVRIEPEPMKAEAPQEDVIESPALKEHSWPEIGRRMEVSTGTVRNTWFRLKQRGELKSYIKELKKTI